MGPNVPRNRAGNLEQYQTWRANGRPVPGLPDHVKSAAQCQLLHAMPERSDTVLPTPPFDVLRLDHVVLRV
ncbi:MAG: hypothetical protein KDH48_09420, partial [Rhodoferax sp.]|nr:hypothetical protein [Rhodoferax sp.]